MEGKESKRTVPAVAKPGRPTGTPVGPLEFWKVFIKLGKEGTEAATPSIEPITGTTPYIRKLYNI